MMRDRCFRDSQERATANGMELESAEDIDASVLEYLETPATRARS